MFKQQTPCCKPTTHRGLSSVVCQTSLNFTAVKLFIFKGLEFGGFLNNFIFVRLLFMEFKFITNLYMYIIFYVDTSTCCSIKSQLKSSKKE